jgi:hypothetical protein
VFYPIYDRCARNGAGFSVAAIMKDEGVTG